MSDTDEGVNNLEKGRKVGSNVKLSKSLLMTLIGLFTRRLYTNPFEESHQ